MPAQKKKPMKKKMAKPAPTRAASRATKKSSSEHPLFKPYLVKEQEEFHKQNPSAQMLIGIFLISVVVFYLVLYLTGNLF